MKLPSVDFVFDRRGLATKKKRGVVELRITHERKRKYISTGVRLLITEWSNGSVVGKRDFKELNDGLQLIKRRCSEIIVQMMENDCFDINSIPTLLKSRMKQNQSFLEYAREQAEIRYSSLKEKTIGRYLVFFRFMEEWRGIVNFADLTESNIKAMDRVLERRGLKEASRYNYHKILKVFVLLALNDGLIKRNPYVRTRIKRGENDGLRRCLTPEEFHRFEEVEIPVKCLERVRDLFVFQTYTLMAYSDLAEFKLKECVEVKGQKVYKSCRQKNGQEFTVVLLPPALAILKKYKNKLPIISNATYNYFLKAAVKFADIDKQVTTHWARHTGATLLLNEGKVPIHVVQHILGHASIRETEKTYAKLLDNTIIESMSTYQSKL